MTRPLKVNGTNPISLIEMTDGEMDYIAHQILTEFGANTVGTGTVSVNPANTSGLTAIGTFVDTTRPDPIGTHPVGTSVISTNYNFYQDLRTATVTGTRPLKFSPGTGLAEQADADVNTHEVARAAARLVTNGLGSYRLQATTPSVGGTWVQMATITDTALGGNGTTYLWRRTDQTAPTTVRPVKYTAGGVQEMSDGEIRSLIILFRNYIVNSAIGQYKAQSAAPSPGTWVQVGDAFTDTREQVTDVAYSGSYGSSFTGFYGNSFTGFYANSFTGFYANSFAGTYANSFAGTYIRYTPGPIYYDAGGGVFQPTYTGYYVGYYTGYFTGYYANSFTGFYANSFTGFYANTFTGFYGGSFTGFYTGPTVQASKENVSNIALWVRTA
jgi:hypothetical protein